jgi:hypothetical protein
MLIAFRIVIDLDLKKIYSIKSLYTLKLSLNSNLFTYSDLAYVRYI